MATTPTAPSPAAATSSELEAWKKSIYEAIQKAGNENELFTQDRIRDFDLLPDRSTITLMKVLQSLTNDRLLITVVTPLGLTWRWRSEADAEKFKLCSTDEQRMVYSVIDEAGGDGIWSKTILSRLNMHDSVLKTALKQLKSKDLITEFKSVDHPNKRMFIKASMRPSERATGGFWYEDSALDEDFIEELQRVIFDYIKRESTYDNRARAPRIPKKGVVKRGMDKGKKRSAGETSGSEDEKSSVPTIQPSKCEPAYLPLPAGFKEYPTVLDIARFISQKGIITDSILGAEDTQKLVDVLVYDGLIESITVGNKTGYRVCRAPRQSTTNMTERDAGPNDGFPEARVNAYTEAPCGACPVFDLCEEGGPVSASNCVYFQRWLGLE